MRISSSFLPKASDLAHHFPGKQGLFPPPKQPRIIEEEIPDRFIPSTPALRSEETQAEQDDFGFSDNQLVSIEQTAQNKEEAEISLDNANVSSLGTQVQPPILAFSIDNRIGSPGSDEIDPSLAGIDPKDTEGSTSPFWQDYQRPASSSSSATPFHSETTRSTSNINSENTPLTITVAMPNVRLSRGSEIITTQNAEVNPYLAAYLHQQNVEQAAFNQGFFTLVGEPDVVAFQRHQKEQAASITSQYRKKLYENQKQRAEAMGMPIGRLKNYISEESKNRGMNGRQFGYLVNELIAEAQANGISDGSATKAFVEEQLDILHPVIRTFSSSSAAGG